jgi:putative membrane protein insertion efficiency factor
VKFLRRLATLPIRFYRRFLSPWKPPMCRFSPTCSQYAVEAIERHGILRGGALATWRILRCHPFCEGGHDPVPPARSGP